jgi:hypothetical protein
MMQRIRPTGPPSKVIILRVISALVLVVAGSASAQTVEGVADSTLMEMIPDEVMAEVPGDLPEDLPEPNAAAVEIPEVDMWSTGVSPTGAVVATPFFPGWGQLYSDNFWKGALGFGTQMYFWTNILNRDRQAVRARDFSQTFPPDDPNYDRYYAIAEESWEQMRDFAWWSGGVLLIIALDAYVGAHLFNFDQDPVPVPDRWDDTFGPVGEAVGFSDPGPTLVVFQWRKQF